MNTLVKVSYFAAARELVGCAVEEIELPEAELPAARLLALLSTRHERLAPYQQRMRLAVNGEIVDWQHPVRGGDEVSVLPPVAGGAPAAPRPVALSVVRAEPLSIDETVAAVAHPGAGAISLFIGIVRDQAEGKAVARLDYEAHPTLAEQELERVLQAVWREHPDTRLAAQHRTGRLAVGDLAVIVAASAPHRGQACDACREAIEQIKVQVPIWKKEWAPDGSAIWVNLD